MPASPESELASSYLSLIKFALLEHAHSVAKISILLKIVNSVLQKTKPITKEEFSEYHILRSALNWACPALHDGSFPGMDKLQIAKAELWAARIKFLEKNYEQCNFRLRSVLRCKELDPSTKEEANELMSKKCNAEELTAPPATRTIDPVKIRAIEKALTNPPAPPPRIQTERTTVLSVCIFNAAINYSVGRPPRPRP